jgi:hypothetical protein
MSLFGHIKTDSRQTLVVSSVSHITFFRFLRLSPLFANLLQWAGKTIALGTFASVEADEKCARAKALTRAWRSTMRPKPSREWVMAELERLGVRVVSGRLGRKAGEEDESEEKKSSCKNLFGFCIILRLNISLTLNNILLHEIGICLHFFPKPPQFQRLSRLFPAGVQPGLRLHRN